MRSHVRKIAHMYQLHLAIDHNWETEKHGATVPTSEFSKTAGKRHGNLKLQ